MGQKKLIRFEELKGFSHVLQYPEGMAGKWAAHFGNGQVLTLELACGKGEYTVGLARMHARRNFIGVDLKGNRIWVGAKTALKENLANVAFLRTQIDQLASYFAKDEVSEIWITFPDPQLRLSKSKKRLTHPKFLRIYQQILRPGGYIHLKTDSPVLYRFTRTVAELYGCTVHKDYADLYKETALPEELKIKTHYEGLDIAQSNRIHYLCFSLPEVLPGIEKDKELKAIIQEYEGVD